MMPRYLPFAQILYVTCIALPHHVWIKQFHKCRCLSRWTTWILFPTTHITLIDPHEKIWAITWTEQKHYQRYPSTTTYANNAAAEDSISIFNTSVANCATKCSQDNAATSQHSKTKKTTPSNLNNFKQSRTKWNAVQHTHTPMSDSIGSSYSN